MVLLVQGGRRFATHVRKLFEEDESLAATVEHIEDLGEALDSVATSRYNVVILAIGRQVSRGFQALSAMHSRAPTLPIIVITSSNDVDLGINAISLGAQDYLMKDEVTSGALRRAIRYSIERQRSHHTLPRLKASAAETWSEEGTDDQSRGRLEGSPPSVRESLVFGEIYRADKVLGLGGMGVVYFGTDTMLDREVAIKVFYGEASGQSVDEIRFTREAKTLAAIEHPGIVPVYAYGKEGDSNYFVMKYVQGTSLESMLNTESAKLGELLPEMKQVFESLDYLHSRGIIHRDLKPSNIIFTPDENAVLVDFGVAKEIGRSRITNTSVLIGTPTYMPPEQAIAAHSVGPASDQYSLGVVVYEILCGRTPFMARSPVAVLFRLVNEPPPPIRAFNPNVSSALESAVMKAISKKPEDRFASCGEFYQALVSAFRASSPSRDDRALQGATRNRSQKLHKGEDAASRYEEPRLRTLPDFDAQRYAGERWLDDLISSPHAPEALSRLGRFTDHLVSASQQQRQSLHEIIEAKLTEPELSERLVEGARVLAFDDHGDGREPLRELVSKSLGRLLMQDAGNPSALLFEAFAWSATPSDLTTWQELITDPDPQRRILGLWALPFAHQSLHHAQKLNAGFKVVQLLFWASNDPDEHVAVTALRSLARIGIPEVAPPLIECYRTTSAHAIRLEAVEALLELATLNSEAIRGSRAALAAEKATLDSDEDELHLKLSTLLERTL